MHGLRIWGLMMGVFAFSASGWNAASAAEQGSAADKSGLIPRKVLFGNPDRSMVRLSPDGKQLSFRGPLDGVMNIWVAPAGNPAAAKAVTQDKGRGIQQYFWAYTNQHILYVQDKDGDENWRVYCIDLGTSAVKDLTPKEGVQARILGVSHRFPNEILIGLNDRNPQLHDVYRVNLTTGDRQLVQQNDQFAGFVTDDDYAVRLGVRMTPDGGSLIEQHQADGSWKEFTTIPPTDSLTTNPAGFDKTGQTLYMLDSRGRDTGALTSIDLATGKQTVIAEDAHADISDVMAHPVEKTIEAVAFTYDRRAWRVLDKKIEPDLAYLKSVAPGEMEVLSRTLDDQQWIVAYLSDAGPVAYYRYDRPAKKATFLFTNHAALENLPLAPMHAVVIPARDGLKLVSYLTLPLASDPDKNARPDQALPLVLFVHGGPWARDEWGYHPYHQWLANRGYAVLSVNFRGSTGFGKTFANAGDKEWAGKMHDDLLDAVNWAVAEKIADPQKVAIMGGSYGGYAALVGLTFTPDTFACGVSIVGPSSLVTLIESIPPYWKPVLDMFATRVGDPRTEEGKQFLLDRSPLTKVDQIRRPLLIAQGASDPRVKKAESDQIVAAMEQKHIPVTYVVFPDEGHGFVRPENDLAFTAVAEAFLAQHLGGNMQPIGDDFKGSSVTVPNGAAEVPGVKEALPQG